MTGIEKLTQSIIDEAENEANDTLEKTKKHVGEARQKMLHAIEHKQNEILAHAEKNGAEQKKRMLAVFGLELRKELLKVKRDALDEAFEKALNALNALPRDQYLDLTGKLLIQSVKTGTETVLVSEAEKLIDEAFMLKFNAALKKQGNAGKLALGRTSEIANGFILQEGGLVINCSFERIIRELRESAETQTAQILFG